MLYYVARLASGSWGVFGPTGLRHGVHRTKLSALRHKARLEAREQRRRKKQT